MLFLVLYTYQPSALAHASIIQQIVPVPALNLISLDTPSGSQSSQQYTDKKPEMVSEVIGNYGFTDDRVS
ncbi:hypothetical protein CEXT_647181 [Caerostris extrusa]|uniref:Uncharacterized protein n=1 Tax=Caerostris extrusa TaxID=172846 RepID=A0AAV4QSC0_CAEEX|nr:hypothetical protein CEXT_647181 [Caerostris extrusa]